MQTTVNVQHGTRLVVDQPGTQTTFVSAGDAQRALFSRHPWSIGGGGAAELKELIESAASARLIDQIETVGRVAHTGADEAYLSDRSTLLRARIPQVHIASSVDGEQIRDWSVGDGPVLLFPYTRDLAVVPENAAAPLFKRLWPYRTDLWERREPGGNYREIGKTWYEFSRFHPERFRGWAIPYSEVATHNHFALAEGGKVFKQTAPAIRLRVTAEVGTYVDLCGLLNGSLSCFWLKQVSHNKGSAVDQRHARQRTSPFEDFYAFNPTKIEQFPLPPRFSRGQPGCLCNLASRLRAKSPIEPLRTIVEPRIATALVEQRAGWEQTRQQMISLQEELDWQCYHLYNLLPEALTCSGDPPPIQLGQRAFEIVMARKMAAGELETTWFARHGSTPITEIPAEWPEAYRRLVQRRIDTIGSDPNIALIEQPEYKRRWNTEPWDSQLERALRSWLLDRLESYFDLDGRMGGETHRRDAEGEEARVDGTGSSSGAHGDAGVPSSPSPRSLRLRGEIGPRFGVELVSTQRVADVARADAEFMQVAELYRGDPSFDVRRLVDELVLAESVPLLPVLRYTESGRVKRGAWERTWELQREEDRIDARAGLPEGDPLRLTEREARALKEQEVGEIPVPPKYAGADFQEGSYWKLRGKLDVPKERWVLFPHCEGPDGAPLIAWAGCDPLQLSRAISAHFVDVLERHGGREDPRLVPLLAGLIELLPWLKQWHNEVDPEYGMRMGDYFEGFLQEEARQMGKTLEEIQSWTPTQRAGRRRRSR